MDRILRNGEGSASLTFTLKAGSGSSVTHRQIDVWIETKTSYEAIGQARGWMAVR